MQRPERFADAPLAQGVRLASLEDGRLESLYDERVQGAVDLPDASDVGLNDRFRGGAPVTDGMGEGCCGCGEHQVVGIHVRHAFDPVGGSSAQLRSPSLRQLRFHPSARRFPRFR